MRCQREMFIYCSTAGQGDEFVGHLISRLSCVSRLEWFFSSPPCGQKREGMTRENETRDSGEKRQFSSRRPTQTGKHVDIDPPADVYTLKRMQMRKGSNRSWKIEHVAIFLYPFRSECHENGTFVHRTR